jgi:hypothetical protein
MSLTSLVVALRNRSYRAVTLVFPNNACGALAY